MYWKSWSNTNVGKYPLKRALRFHRLSPLRNCATPKVSFSSMLPLSDQLSDEGRNYNVEKQLEETRSHTNADSASSFYSILSFKFQNNNTIYLLISYNLSLYKHLSYVTRKYMRDDEKNCMILVCCRKDHFLIQMLDQRQPPPQGHPALVMSSTVRKLPAYVFGPKIRLKDV